MVDDAHCQQPVRDIYLELLGRDPDDEGLRYWSSVAAKFGVDAVRNAIKGSDEYRARSGSEPLQAFPGYREDELDIIREFENPDAKPQAGFVVDFLGGRIRTISLWQSARHLDGQLTGLPIPGDYHSEAAEWIGVLKAARSAQSRFVALELGAGFGTWTVASGLAARSRGIRDVRLCAVEADPQHFQLLTTHFADNGFEPDDHTLLCGAVGVRAGKARWPVIEDSRDDWGSRPTEVGDTQMDYLGRRFERYVDIDVFAMSDILQREKRWDLVHLDVQGAEFAICKAAISDLQKRVSWLVVGTHSRLIEGELLQLLFKAGWKLENEKPCKFRYNSRAAGLDAMTVCDGVQVWRNPKV